MLWIPLFLTIGIGLFFICDQYQISLSVINTTVILLVIIVIFMPSQLGSWRNIFQIIFIAITIIILGYAAATYRTLKVNATILPYQVENASLFATIDSIEHRSLDSRLYLKEINIKGIDYSQTPKKIRVNVRNKIRNILNLGDRIKLKANLLPPPFPTYPDSFNFARFAYFKGLGAIGYVTGKLYVVKTPDYLLNKNNHWIDDIIFKVTLLRNKIAMIIKESMPAPASVVANGMLIGIVSEIGKNELKALRISGTAHLIAISGMHVVTVAGLIFFIIQYCGKYIPYIALRFNLQKVASFSSIIGIWCYLLLSGAPISAQRAVVTSTLFLTTMLIDRDPCSMRALSIAAIVIILATPENIFSPSLQMSFSACISLIAFFNFWNKQKINQHLNRYSKIANYIIQLILASAVASIATSPFILYHFHQFSIYSILANLICVPLTEFFIMPFGLLSLLFMPFNLEKIPLFFMQHAINLMLNTAKFWTDMPYSVIQGIVLSDLQIMIIALSLYLVCITSSSIMHYFGVISLVFSILVIIIVPKQNPELLISSSGKLFAIRQDLIDKDKSKTTKNLILSSRRTERYTRNSWEQIIGQKNFYSKVLNKIKTTTCDQKKCSLYWSHNLIGEFIYDKKSRKKDGTILLLNEEIVLNQEQLKEYGAVALYDCKLPKKTINQAASIHHYCKVRVAKKKCKKPWCEKSN